MTDKTNYGQSLMHMIKGNLGTGILAMPASFAHTGLIYGVIGLPLLCLAATYCVHILVKSSSHLESKSKGLTFKYASLSKYSFKVGPSWMRASSGLMSVLVDSVLIIAQIGCCCVYLVFVVYNITTILATYRIKVEKSLVFLIIFPITLLLSYIRTLKKLAIASAFANILQAVGISIILEYLIRGINDVDLNKRDKFRPFNEAALGFGSAMFAFEGISVVLPIYTRMKNPTQMVGFFGVINFSYVVLLCLYFVVGFFGFWKFGHDCKDSITLNLPPEPLYDAVRAIFAVSIFLTYPLQFYVPQEIVWNWIKQRFLIPKVEVTMIRTTELFSLPQESGEKGIFHKFGGDNLSGMLDTRQSTETTPKFKIEHSRLVHYEYCCRTVLVMFTFVLAISVPKLNLLMDLIGSVSGTMLSIILPPIIHIAAFWDDTKGLSKIIMVTLDSLIIAVGFLAGGSGAFFSFLSILDSFK